MVIGELVAPDEGQEDRQIDHVENVEMPFGQVIPGGYGIAKHGSADQPGERNNDSKVDGLPTVAELRQEVQQKNEAANPGLPEGDRPLTLDIVNPEGLLQASRLGSVGALLAVD